MTDSYEYKYSRSKRRDRGHYLSREAEMLESSTRTNKMLRFMEVDEDYKRFGAKSEKEFKSAINEGIGNPKAK